MENDNFSWIEQLHRYKSPEVRDLFWCIFSPDLLDDRFSSSILPTHLLEKWRKESATWFSTLDEDPTELLEWMMLLKTKRLGYRFEHFVHFFFRSFPGIELIANNVQHAENGITIGELDFIVRYENQIVHIEVSVKFYCQFESGESLSDWIGPSANDRLDLKWNRLIHHQLPLVAKMNDLPPIDFSFSSMKGMLYPAENDLFPTFVNANLIPGTSIHWSDFQTKDNWKSKKYWLLERPFWLSDSHVPSQRLPVCSHLDVCEKYQENLQHIQTLRIAWMEEGRYKTGFILGENWPEFII